MRVGVSDRSVLADSLKAGPSRQFHPHYGGFMCDTDERVNGQLESPKGVAGQLSPTCVGLSDLRALATSLKTDSSGNRHHPTDCSHLTPTGGSYRVWP